MQELKLHDALQILMFAYRIMHAENKHGMVNCDRYMLKIELKMLHSICFIKHFSFIKSEINIS